MWHTRGCISKGSFLDLLLIATANISPQGEDSKYVRHKHTQKRQIHGESKSFKIEGTGTVNMNFA
jgi:hypothetical protein